MAAYFGSGDLSVRHHRGAEGYYELDWEGDRILAQAIEASRLGINDTTALALEMALATHPWENRTGQLEAAHFRREAIIEELGTGPSSTPHVWGEWGIEDTPRLSKWQSGMDPASKRWRRSRSGELITNKDVAMWLEFGTKKIGKPSPYRWIYPTWDATKVLMPLMIKEHYEELNAARWRPGMGEGAFRSTRSMWAAA